MTATVLVVDDNGDNRLSLSDFLIFKGCSVLEAGDGVEALLVAANMPQGSVVFSDTQMPNLDGVELCKKLRALYGNNLRIIGSSVGSMYNGMPVRDAWLEAGADEYVGAGNSPEYILSVINSVAASSS